MYDVANVHYSILEPKSQKIILLDCFLQLFNNPETLQQRSEDPLLATGPSQQPIKDDVKSRSLDGWTATED